MDKLLAAPLTSTIRGIPTEVPLDKNDGVPRDCVVALDSTAPVLKAYLVDRLTTLSAERMLEVCRALAIATACP